MIIDKQNQLSDRQAITATANSTDSVDMGAALDQGPGAHLVLSGVVTEAFNTLTSLTIAVQCDDNGAFSSARTLTSITLTLAELSLGRRFSVPLPLERVERHIRATYTVTGTNPTLGRVSTWLTTADMVERLLANA
jgi:hypothetical protein